MWQSWIQTSFGCVFNCSTCATVKTSVKTFVHTNFIDPADIHARDIQDCQQRLCSTFDLLLIFLCSLIQTLTLTLTPPPNNALLAIMDMYNACCIDQVCTSLTLLAYIQCTSPALLAYIQCTSPALLAYIQCTSPALLAYIQCISLALLA